MVYHKICALSERLRTCAYCNCLSADLVTVYTVGLVDKVLEVYGNFEYWTLYDELFIMMKVIEK